MHSVKKVIVVVVLVISSLVNAQKGFDVQVIGKGEPVLFFPGFACKGEVWDDMVKEISKTHECHVFTFAGFGGVAPIKKPWLPKIKTSVSDYISERHLENATIIGHSLGGILSLWLAEDDNFDFKKVIAVDALPSIGALMMSNFNSENIVYDTPYNKQILAMDENAFAYMSNQMVAGMTSHTEKQELIKEWMLMADRETYVYGYTDLLKLDLRDSIAQIESPVVVLAATEPYGLETARATYETQYKNLENYTLKFANGSAHFIMYDQPEWLLNNIKLEL